METQLFSLALVMIVCACSTSSLPANGRQGDIDQLVSLLGKLKNMERARQQQQQQNYHHYHNIPQQQQLLSGVGLATHHQTRPFSSPSSSSALKALAASDARPNFPADLTPHDVTNSLLLGGDRDGLDLDLADDYRSTAADRSPSGAPAGGSSSGGAVSSQKGKRQGAWSYDYGLGGGRFGKRNYGDYGIGGGRYGRDVDHVDISDGSDADDTTL